MIIDIPNIRHILGWLAIPEAVALQHCTWAVSGMPGDIVEIGSYCGKSTIVIADALRQGCSGLLHSVDPHYENEKLYGVNSYTMLMDNLVKHQVADFVQIHRATSQTVYINMKNTLQLKMLFIDGAHDYQHVLQDYVLWQDMIFSHGFLIFHDSYEEGVKPVIQQAEEEGWISVLTAHSLTAMRRTGIVQSVDDHTAIQAVKVI